MKRRTVLRLHATETVILLFGFAFGQTFDWTGSYTWAPHNVNHIHDAAADGAGGCIWVGETRDEGDTHWLALRFSPGGTVVWAREIQYGTSNYEYASGVCSDGVGNFYVVGRLVDPNFHFNMALIKYDLSGSEVWRRFFPSSGYHDFSGSISLIDGQGNVICAGAGVNSTNSNGLPVAKYGGSGSAIWSRLITYPEIVSNIHLTKGIIGDAASIYLAGWFQNNQGGPKLFLTKIASDGSPLWLQIYDGTVNGDIDLPTSIAARPDGGVYVVGFSYFNGTREQFALAYDSVGNQVWARRTPGEVAPYQVCIDDAGNVVIFGTLVLKYSQAGDLLWSMPINATGGAIESDGDYLVAAYGDVNRPWVLYGMTPSGELTWYHDYSLPGTSTYTNKLVLDNSGNAFIAGHYADSVSMYWAYVSRFSPATVSPCTAMSVPRGIVLSGNIDSLQFSDDDRLVLRPGVVLSSGEAPIQLVLQGSTVVGNPSDLRVVVESRANQGNILQKVEMYDYQAAQYISVDSRQLTLSDNRIEVHPTTNFANFVVNSTGEMQLKLSYKAGGPVLSYPWQVQIDQCKWKVSR